jgi:hypothetical protein
LAQLGAAWWQAVDELAKVNPGAAEELAAAMRAHLSSHQRRHTW